MTIEDDMIEAMKRVLATSDLKIENHRLEEEDGFVYFYDGERLLGFMNAGQYRNLVERLGLDYADKPDGG